VLWLRTSCDSHHDINTGDRKVPFFYVYIVYIREYNMRSQMQYLIWSSIVAQLEKAGDTSSLYYRQAIAKVKFNQGATYAKRKTEQD
jgi:hypothetical protein